VNRKNPYLSEENQNKKKRFNSAVSFPAIKLSKKKTKELNKKTIDELFNANLENERNDLLIILKAKDMDLFKKLRPAIVKELNKSNVNKELIVFLLKDSQVNPDFHELSMPGAGLNLAVEKDLPSLFKALIKAYDLSEGKLAGIKDYKYLNTTHNLKLHLVTIASLITKSCDFTDFFKEIRKKNLSEIIDIILKTIPKYGEGLEAIKLLLLQPQIFHSYSTQQWLSKLDDDDLLSQKEKTSKKMFSIEREWKRELRTFMQLISIQNIYLEMMKLCYEKNVPKEITGVMLNYLIDTVKKLEIQNSPMKKITRQLFVEEEIMGENPLFYSAQKNRVPWLLFDRVQEVEENQANLTNESDSEESSMDSFDNEMGNQFRR
jgi:hypothetical protein